MSGAIRSTTSNLGLGVLNFNFPNWGDDANNNTKILDAAFQLLGVSIGGVWENSTLYTQGVIFVDADTGEVFRAEVTHISAEDGSFFADRTANPTYWGLIEGDYHIRGQWTTATVYVIGDIVYDEPEYCVAICIVDHTSAGASVRVDEALGNWQFIVDMGDAVDAAEAAAESAADSAELASEIAGASLGPAIAATSEKTALHDDDKFAITDSEASDVLGHSTWGNIKDKIQALADTLYATLAHTHTTANVTGLDAALALKAPLAGPSFTGTASFSGPVSFNSTVGLLADPVSSLQPATKQYVDGLVSGLGTRTTVRVATTANITIATALNNGDTLDGVSLATGNLVLVKDQTSAAQNGIYVVGVSPARDTAYDTYNEHVGVQINVQEGTTNADTIWLSYANTGGTLNTTAIPFTRLVTSGELLASNNLSDLSNPQQAFWNIQQAASTSIYGTTILAPDASAQAKATSHVITASNLAALGASTGFAGLVRLATNAEVMAGSDTTIAASAASAYYAAETRAAAHAGYMFSFVNYAAGNAALGSGAIGTWAYCMCTGGTVVFGGGSAGANLFPAGHNNAGNIGSGSALSGSWRCMGHCDSAGRATLWLRYA